MATEVMRRPGIELPFRRTVKDRKGNPLRVLLFEPGQIVKLESDDFRAVRNDVGRALVIVDRDDAGRPKPRRDPAAANPSEAARRQAFEEGRQAGRQEALDELAAAQAPPAEAASG